VSNDAKAEFEALDELESVVQHIAAELATWRRRALKAEAQRTELGVDHDAVAARERIIELEEVSADMSARLEAARERVERLLSRLRFLEDQVDTRGQV
jgi:hypothetical protein